MIREHRDIVRLRLNAGEPARVPPLLLKLKPDCRPIRAKPRRYPPEKRAFLVKYVEKLTQMGFVTPTHNAEWVAAPRIVPKAPPAIYRLTMDYRPVNATTEKITWPIPHIDTVLSDLRGAQAFATIDFCSGYWQLPLHENSRPLHAFMTTDGIVQPNRTTQESCNSAANFQACVEPCFTGLRQNLLDWLDDFAIYAEDEVSLLTVLRRFLTICREKKPGHLGQEIDLFLRNKYSGVVVLSIVKVLL